MFIVTLYYGYDLFALDEKLSKIQAKTANETLSVVGGAGIEAEQKVESFLLQSHIQFKKNAVLKINGTGTIADFVIPSEKNPKYLVEVKARPFRSRIYSASLQYEKIRSEMQVKTILISNFGEASPDLLKVSEAYWDFLVDLQNLEELREIIKF